MFATASEGENVYVWCAARRRLLRMVSLGNKGRCVHFSPDGRLLAACSNDQFIDVFDRSQGYKKIARCTGHSSTVRHVDWSADSAVIRTVCSAYEILYFSPRTVRASDPLTHSNVYYSLARLQAFSTERTHTFFYTCSARILYVFLHVVYTGRHWRCEM